MTAAELATMRAEHKRHSCLGRCEECLALNSPYPYEDYCEADLDAWPCEVVRLLAHFAPGPVPHLAGIEERLHVTVYPPSARNPMVKRVLGMALPDDPGISAGLFGPTCSEELPS